MPERGRLWAAPALALAAAALSCGVYDLAPVRIANVAILVYAVCLVLAPAGLYPWLRSRGAGSIAAGAGALVVLAAWLAKELVAVSATYPLPETLFYALNPVCAGLFVFALLQMALAELVLRRRRGRPLRGPALLVAAILFAAAALAVAARGNGGRELFYAYAALHARLFGG